jgi:uncharacterized protein
MRSTQAKKVESILAEVIEWAGQSADISAVSLVGSWARGTARKDSDIDLMLLSSNPSKFRNSEDWINQIDWGKAGSKVKAWKDDDYGLAWSRHICLEDKTKIECSFGYLSWASTNPIDAGTCRVVSDGCRILYDPEELMAKLVSKIKSQAGHASRSFERFRASESR